MAIMIFYYDKNKNLNIDITQGYIGNSISQLFSIDNNSEIELKIK